MGGSGIATRDVVAHPARNSTASIHSRAGDERRAMMMCDTAQPGITVHRDVKRARGIEPPYGAWEAPILPLNYAREIPVLFFSDVALPEKEHRYHFSRPLIRCPLIGALRPEGHRQRRRRGRRRRSARPRARPSRHCRCQSRRWPPTVVASAQQRLTPALSRSAHSPVSSASRRLDRHPDNQLPRVRLPRPARDCALTGR